MNYDHDAIRKAYPNVISISDHAGAFDIDEKQVTLDQDKIAAARVELDTEYAKIKYKDDRAKAYPRWADQLDYIYHNGIEKWKTDMVDPVKKKYPKPE